MHPPVELTDDALYGPMDGVRRGYVESHGLQLHYARCGAGPQTVVFLHEVPRSWTQFGPSLFHVGQFAQAIAIDLPGYGNSDPYPEKLTAFQYAEIIADAISQLVTGPLWIAGVHSGALFAAEIGAHQLVQTTGLLLTGLPMFGFVEPPPASPPPDVLGATYDGSHVARIVPHFQQKWGFWGPTHRLHDAAVQALLAVDRLYAGYDAVFECDTEQLLPMVGCEVHFISAEEDGLFAHDRSAARMLPNSVMHIARGIGRDLPWSAPSWYASRVGQALHL